MWIYVATLACVLLVWLGLTGRLHWLFALLGGALPLLGRWLPVILRLLNTFNTFKWIRNAAPSFGRSHRSRGQTSELNTRYLTMVLDHDSGEMNGRVLEGPFRDRMLSDLNLTELLQLLESCQQDADSVQVLQAYLDRVHPDWTEKEEAEERQQDNSGESANISKQQAWEILGLEPGADEKEIIDAHRRLMQRMHPDRGGSSYLAARINEAKRVLLGGRKGGRH
ncbi:MAG: DnaJ domain-containing protein [Pseudomonadales bacterium]|nr:DnaJ domain-containing protein [Pseudomonadales bacterium]